MLRLLVVAPAVLRMVDNAMEADEEPLEAIHRALFDWGPDPNRDASIRHWVTSVPRDDGEMFVHRFYELDRQLKRRLDVEAELEQLRLLLGITPDPT